LNNIFPPSRQKAQKEAAKRSAKGSQLGARAAGLQVKEKALSIKLRLNTGEAGK
jgi:hypothetical protein